MPMQHQRPLTVLLTSSRRVVLKVLLLLRTLEARPRLTRSLSVNSNTVSYLNGMVVVGVFTMLCRFRTSCYDPSCYSRFDREVHCYSDGAFRWQVALLALTQAGHGRTR